MSIRERRIEKGWTQEELARHSGLSTRTIQRIETSKSTSLESLKCLAAVFETSISVLVHEQTMTNQKYNDKTEKVQLLKIERDALEFAQSILSNPNKRENKLLTKIELDALKYAKRLLASFQSKTSS
ncbi:helix-turn-helix domain-containing protein [Glaciecola sp. 1036]|uniref:helix-turn-helix domain-containing protein n=1 Tax=Alteromonadaceae TaxID=72275 RepID=UPI003D059DE3